LALHNGDRQIRTARGWTDFKDRLRKHRSDVNFTGGPRPAILIGHIGEIRSGAVVFRPFSMPDYAFGATEKAAYMADHADNRPKLAREFFIQGITRDGKQFRPSDWAERLCGVMSRFRPEGSGGRNAHLQYSPYVRPTILDGVKSVVVDEELRNIEPLAYHFVLDFAKDNNLQIVDACLLPDPNEKP
jgi:hypothetical protein